MDGDEQLPVNKSTDNDIFPRLINNLASFVNWFFVLFCLGVIVYFGGAKAWCSSAVVFVLAIIYGVLYANKSTLNIDTNTLFVGKMLSDVNKYAVIGGLFVLCCGVVILGCFAVDRTATTIKLASQNAALFLGATFVVSTIFPSLVHLFGNTFGYWTLPLLSTFKPNLSQDVGSSLSEYIDYRFLITLINDDTTTTTDELFNKLNVNVNVDELKPFVQQKTAIGHLAWVSLASIATIITTLSGRTFYDLKIS